VRYNLTPDEASAVLPQVTDEDNCSVAHKERKIYSLQGILTIAAEAGIAWLACSQVAHRPSPHLYDES